MQPAFDQSELPNRKRACRVSWICSQKCGLGNDRYQFNAAGTIRRRQHPQHSGANKNLPGVAQPSNLPLLPGLFVRAYQPTPDEEGNDKQYDQSQQQRYLKRQVRNSKRECAMLGAMGDKEGFDAASLRLKQRQQALRDFTDSTSRTNRVDRTQVFGYNKSVAGKVTQSAKRQAAEKLKKQEEERIVEEICSVGGFAKSVKIHLSPTPINVSSLSFDDAHINAERKHNVTEAKAKQWIKNASISVTVWAGQFERYYGADGSAYVNLPNSLIRTAFSKEQYDDVTKLIMQVVKKNGIL